MDHQPALNADEIIPPTHEFFDFYFNEQGERVELYIQQWENIYLLLPKTPSAQRSIDWKVLEKVPIAYLKKLFADRLTYSKAIFVVDTLTDQLLNSQTPRHSIGNQLGAYVLEDEQIRILNVDHHGKLPENQGKISSHQAASGYEKIRGSRMHAIPMVITHTDPDSILSALMLRGQIPTSFWEEYSQAVIASDHTGEETDLGDLISAVQVENNLMLTITLVQEYFAYKEKKRADGTYAFEQFLKYLREQKKIVSDGSKDMLVADAVHAYRDRRTQASVLFLPQTLEEGNDTPSSLEYKLIAKSENGWVLKDYGKGVFLVDGEAGEAFLDNELLPFAIPTDLRDKARVVLFSRKMPKSSGAANTYEVKARVMPSWVGKINLQTLGISEPPYNLGCRHNAGSTFRAGGTVLHGSDLAQRILTVLS